MWWAYIRGGGAYIRGGLIVGGLRYYFCCSVQTTTQLYHNIEDEHLKTSVNFITHPKEKSGKHKPAYVTRYGPKGFVVHGSRVLGSLVILPGLFLHWKVIN
jgi:hypothetical protein